MQVLWTDAARTDIDQIRDINLERSVRFADRVEDRIVEGVARLLRFPRSGRPGKVDGLRELVIPDVGYIVTYAVAGERLLVLRVTRGLPDRSRP
jgi:plasmid stabilization system protein ParE